MIEKTQENTSFVVTETLNSYEFGPAKNRYKLFFKDADDLKNQIDKLKALGLYQEEFAQIQ